MQAARANPVTPLRRKLSTSKIGLDQLDLGSWSTLTHALRQLLLTYDPFSHIPNSFHRPVIGNAASTAVVFRKALNH